MTKGFPVTFILVFIGFSDTWHLSSLWLSSAPEKRKEVIIQSLRSFEFSWKKSTWVMMTVRTLVFGSGLWERQMISVAV